MRTKPRRQLGRLSPVSLRGHSVLQPPSSSNSRSQSPSCSSTGSSLAANPWQGASPSIPPGSPAPSPPPARPLLPQPHQLLQMFLLEPLQHICDSRGHGILAPDLPRVPLNALHGRAEDFTHLAAPFNFLLTSFLFLCHFKTFANSCCCCSRLFLAPSPPKDVGFEYIRLSV